MNKKTLLMTIIMTDILAVGLFSFALIRQNGDGDLFSNPLIYVALALFILGPILALISFLTGSGSNNADLLQSGLPANATVLDVWDKRFGSKDGKAQVGLKLRINPPSDSSYETKTTAPVSPLNPQPYRAGMVLRVRYDPNNPRRVAVDDGSAPSAAAPDVPSASGPIPFTTNAGASFNIQFPQGSALSPEQQQMVQNAMTHPVPVQFNNVSLGNMPPVVQKMVQSIFADADHNGIPDVMEQPGMQGQGVQVINLNGLSGRSTDPQAKIEKLAQLRDAGLLTPEVFETLKAKILTSTDPGQG
jgi:hypothetical protein